jgi:hypothetical protein
MQKMEEKSMWLCEEARGNKRIKNKGVGHGWKLGLKKKKSLVANLEEDIKDPFGQLMKRGLAPHKK